MIPSRSFSKHLFGSNPSLIRSLAASCSSSALSTEPHGVSPEPKPEQWETVDEYKILISKNSKYPSAFRMAEIPWQTKVANAVQLIGKVGVPVKVVTAKDGSVSAVTILVRHKDADDLPQFWIPVVFQGDLADAAAWHLKENDTVYVTGQLSGDAALSLQVGDKQSNLQVIVQSINFVQELFSKKKCQLGKEGKQRVKEMADPSFVHDVFSKKESILGKGGKPRETEMADPAFVHDVFPKKKSLLPMEDTPQAKQLVSPTAKLKKSKKPSESLWEDLIANPKEWLDCRKSKQNGSVKPKFPDFKHKNTGDGLWFSSAPDSVQEKLNDLTFTMLDEKGKDAAAGVRRK